MLTQSVRGRISVAAIFFALGSSASVDSAAPIVVDGAAAHHAWDGFGGLSAGASSRLLRDYAQPQRDDILDLLYKPSHAASLKICKVEIGGDDMSTDGTEPSHMHHRDDLSCERGYELWLAKEALARNPNVATFALVWGAPGWVGNGSFFSPEMWAYKIAFCDCFLEKVGRPVDFLGIWNERYWGGTDYVVGLRAALDAAGHERTRIVLPDSHVANDPELLAAIANNASFRDAFDVAGLHGDPQPVPILEATNHRYWQSETGFDPISLSEDWRGAQAWARNLNRNYITANITGTITWSTIWSVLPGLPYDGRGIMMANTPWSGNFNDSAPIWVSAHFGQFLEIGWRHLLTGRGAGILAPLGGGDGDAGSCTSFVPPASVSDLSLICETMGVAAAGPRVFSLTGGLPGPGTSFCVWQTTDSARFVRLSDVVVAADGSLTLVLPADGIVTASTVCTATHGSPSAPVPPPAPLALPYSDSFDEADCPYDSLPRYLSDQGGSFACRNGSLAQVVTQRPGGNDWYVTPDPITLLGDYTPWSDVTISVTATIPAVHLRDDPNAELAECEAAPVAGKSAQVWAFGAPFAGYVSNTLEGQSTCLNLYGCEPRLIYYECCYQCGCSLGQGFNFSLNADGTLSAGLLPGLCAGVQSDNVTVSMEACAAGSTLQQWSLSPTTGQLRSAATGTCLTSSLRPVVPYARVCSRITSYSGFDGLAPVPGYCLVLTGNGAWSVTAGNLTLANGTLAGFDVSQPTPIELPAKGDSLSARARGAALGGPWGGLGRFAGGMVAIGSGVHEAVFDDFSVAPA